MDRKGMKANARKAYKRHYWMIVVICLFASVFGVAYSSSTWSVNASSPSATVQEDGTAQSDNVSKVLENLLVGDESQARRQVEHNREQIVQNDTNAMMGRKRGVFASLLNSFSSVRSFCRWPMRPIPSCIMTASPWPYQSSYPWPFTFSSSRNIADSLKTVLFIGFLYA